MSKIKITLHPDGTPEIEVIDHVGPDCLTFTEKLEKRLGRPEGQRTLKPEFKEKVPREHGRQRERI